MAISKRNSNLLWAAAAGKCSFPNCNQRLFQLQTVVQSACILGEMAHIQGENSGSNRHHPELTPEQCDDYSNLILLCPTHHTLIDKPENETSFPVDMLREMKTNHEVAMLSRTESNALTNKYQVAAEIIPLTRENKEIFLAFGPRSERARRNPYSESAFTTWITERLAVIVPNNRKIMQILDTYKHLFFPEEITVINRLRLHVRSYESWVSDEINYEGVIRFPVEFENLMEELAHARA